MVKSILSKIKLDNNWVSVDIGNYNDCYVILVKESIGKKDTINPKDIQTISFELGIDSGIKNKPITISRFSINFSEMTSRDEDVNSITGFTKLQNIPSNFYVRPIAMYNNNNNRIDKGDVNIALNIHPVDLG